MGLSVELVPLTDCSPRKLAVAASRVVNTNLDRLRIDFPHLADLYCSPQKAEETIKRRQRQMRYEGAFTVCAVRLGWQADSDSEDSLPMRFVGMTSHNPSDIPAAKGHSLTGKPGVHVAMWLDKHRPPQLKHAGVAITSARIDHLVANSHTEGRPWALILPTNTASRTNWEHTGYKGGGFATDGVERVYPSLDSHHERLLYVARFTLEQLRGE